MLHEESEVRKDEELSSMMQKLSSVEGDRSDLLDAKTALEREIRRLEQGMDESAHNCGVLKGHLKNSQAKIQTLTQLVSAERA